MRPVLSASSCISDAPNLDHLNGSWLGLLEVVHVFSCTVEPRTECSSADVVSPVLHRAAVLPTLTCFNVFPNADKDAGWLAAKTLCWLIFILSSTRTPGPALQSYFSLDQSPARTNNGVTPTWVWYLTFPFVKFNEIPVRPFFQPVESLLKSSTVYNVFQ